ncbi:hypothetical protein FisN_18Lh265 [Fistulifera solaris]|uniref:Methyltransferase domain-containing protein n=1 Tax=Fistulifera solaris TaxID=1519565 RepID=A0A1Z5JUB6_FISSO|nr:hypothetical protein FisN_18Lh265 [Fistulifera solaris]|eukprot:GAX17610.1 hypothetical protein FisN_18Lh265 [Fistulifera solaris]
MTATADQGKDTSIMNSFLTELQASIQQQTFSSITLYGPSKTTLKKITDNEKTRGCLIRITGRLIQSKYSSKNGNKKTTCPSTQCQVTYKYHLATDIVKNWPLSSVPQSIQSLLLWTTSTSKSDSDGNKSSLLLDPSVVVPSEWGTPTPQQSQLRLHTATLETTTARYQLDLRTNTLSRHEITSTAATHTPQPHDRSKAVPVSTEAPMWQALGILNEQGKPRLNMASKYKQCQTFVQLLAQRIPFGSETSSSTMPKKILVTDMGCGRGYLTFALHHYLSEQQEKHDGSFTVHSVGMDVRPKLVQEIQGIADGLGPPFDTLQFMTSTIEDYTSTMRTSDHGEDYQILMALHACDTATDDALWAGIQQEMDLLVVAPCCHRQIRPQLDSYHAQQKQHALSDVWQYNIYRERHAESVTDTLRALLLEWAGYQVQVFEFIGGEHTSKNVMITAVRTTAATRRKNAGELEQRIQSLASFHGIHQHTLAQHLGLALQLVPGQDVNNETVKKRSKYGLPQ